MERTITNRTNKEYSVKMLICLAAGLLVTKLIGYETVVTVPITAYLVCWSYRGLRGAIEYFGFRLRIQLVFVLFDTALMLLLGKLVPGWPAYIRFVIVSCISVPVFLRVYYKWKIMPINLTAVFSNLIITAGLMATPWYGSRRILWNIAGLLVGVAATYLIPGTDKIGRCTEKLREMMNFYASRLQEAVRSDFRANPSAAADSASARAELASIAAYMAVIDKDCTKAVRFPMSLVPEALYNSRYRAHKAEIAKMHRLLAAFRCTLDLSDCLRTPDNTVAGMESERKELFRNALLEIAGSVKKAAAGEKPEALPGVFTRAESEQETILLSKIALCSDSLSKFI